jgi:hypothetical protein
MMMLLNEPMSMIATVSALAVAITRRSPLNRFNGYESNQDNKRTDLTNRQTTSWKMNQ